MLTAYIQAAMRQAQYDILEEHEGFYGEIPGLDGVWAKAATLEACRQELQSVLEGWIILGLRMGDALPVVGGLNLTPPLEVIAAEGDEAAPAQPTAPAAASSGETPQEA